MGISGYVWDVCGCVQVCMGVSGCTRVCVGMHGCSVGVCGCGRVCMIVCVDLHRGEFSEFLPENRVPTSADFNKYPIRIFFLQS